MTGVNVAQMSNYWVAYNGDGQPVLRTMRDGKDSLVGYLGVDYSLSDACELARIDLDQFGPEVAE